jgi:uncharacterized cysteine cluster protein YcgN (CxxCxxCC family)
MSFFCFCGALAYAGIAQKAQPEAFLSENEDEDDEDAFYDETCRIVGQCCLMLAINDAETDRAQLVYQVETTSLENPADQ